MTNTEICNMALAQIKNQGIRSFDDNTLQSAVARMYYDITRRDLLRGHDWGFARRDTKLPLLDVRHRNFKYVYAYPNDCLLALNLYGERPGDRAPRGQRTGAGGYENMLEYADVFSPSSEVTAIASDVESAYLEYIYDARNADAFPDDFTLALTYKLALTFAAPLAVSDNVIGLVSSLYQNALSKSTVANKNEDKERAQFTSSILAARGGRGYAGRI